MIDNLPVKVDYAGRIILPKNVRNKFDIKENDRLLLSSDRDKILLKKDTFNKNFLKLIEKLEYLKDKYIIDYLLTDKRTIVKTSEKYNNYLGKQIDKTIVDDIKGIEYSNKSVLNKSLNIETPHYYCFLSVDSYTNGFIFIILNDITYKKEVFSHLKMLI